MSHDASIHATFYRPDDGAAGDFIPFYWNGEYHLFYLKDYRGRPNTGEGVPWFHLVTKDFINFEEWGEAIPRGTREQRDLCIFTGSVMQAKDTFHIFYTGHNPGMNQYGQPAQVILHATSPDLRTWTKDPSFILPSPVSQGYEADDWRDPFVFWNKEAGKYWMLLAARKNTGPSRNRGCTALATSNDLVHWQVEDPLWEPDMYITHECPDLFKMGDWWYLLYSTYSERNVTHYRMSRSCKGPWIAPADDCFDNRAFYAAKTASDGHKRYLFGWLASRAEDKDTGAWQWGGNLVTYEIKQRKDGSLSTVLPASCLSQYRKPMDSKLQQVLGKWNTDRKIDATSRNSMCLLSNMPQECMIQASISIDGTSGSAGLLLRANDSADEYYQIRLDASAQRLAFDRWPRPSDQPFMLERPLNIKPGTPTVIKAVVSGSCIVICANDDVALSCRVYDHPTGQYGLFATECVADFTGVECKTGDTGIIR